MAGGKLPFQDQPLCSYCGHTSDVLDLSWSKVMQHIHMCTSTWPALWLAHLLYSRISSCCLAPWTRL